MIAASSPSSDASRSASSTNANALARLLALQRPCIMGILNVTPDSFSDGGAFLSPGAAVAHAEQMIAEGADIIDIGAESSRPYGNPVAVSATEELRRLESVLPAAVRMGRPVSIDTMKATVAAWALDRGAAMVNDVWGLQRDSEMAGVATLAALARFNLSLEEAAQDLGANATETFFLVTLPLIKPAIIAGALFAFIISWINVEISIFNSTANLMPIPVKLFNYIQYNVDPMIAAVSATTIYIAVIVVILIDRVIGIERAATNRT